VLMVVWPEMSLFFEAGAERTTRGHRVITGRVRIQIFLSDSKTLLTILVGCHDAKHKGRMEMKAHSIFFFFLCIIRFFLKFFLT
jgi:hypothetical protein